MNKDWSFGKTFSVAKQQKTILAQCRSCEKLFNFPSWACETCSLPIDLCAHGIACQECSYKLILAWVKEGNLKKGVLSEEELKEFKALLKEKFNQELYEEGEYLRAREVKDD